ncbi:hypothetical protein niasHT_035222 [Heterodera trifolii]|uniref:Uncharacterized protein n=1 Tax=Heterodera trifolii TaxID=157864 RepID=A0ABD2J3V1_9BILA
MPKQPSPFWASSAEARRKRKEWRQERAQKGGSTPKSPRQTTEAPSTTGEGTSTETMPSALNAEPRQRPSPRPLSTTPIRRHVRVRPTTIDKTTGTDFRAAVQSTQTVLETVDTATQTETEFASIQKLCAELNKAKRRIATLERQLEKKTDEVKRLKKRPTDKHRHRLKRVSSLEDLSRKSRTTRAKEIARNLSDLFRPGTPIPEIDKVVRQARHQANFISPKKPTGKWTRKGRTRKNERISPILDIQVTLMLGFSWRQRQQLKNTLINMRDDTTPGGLDFLASTHEVKALRRRLTTHARFEVVRKDKKSTLICTNIRQVLVQRVETLLGQGRMKEFGQKLLVAIVGDRGCGTVKIALQIGNLLSDVNSPKNLTLIAFWEGPETRKEMEIRLAPVLEQLEQITNLPFGRNLTIEWFLTGDMAFICAWMGHMGPASVFPCALCRIPYKALGNTIIGPRTAKSIVGGAALFSYRTADTGKHTTRDSISHAKTQEYTGDHMKRLLLASTEIRSIGTPFSMDIADLLDEVRELHIFGRADLLTPEQIDNFSNKCLGIHGFFKKLWETYPTEFDTNNAAGFTPKLHWLLAHGPDFAKRWGWFAWISEQGIEHLHHVLNKQSDRFKRYKGDELLLKIGEHQTLLNSIFDRHIGFL